MVITVSCLSQNCIALALMTKKSIAHSSKQSVALRCFIECTDSEVRDSKKVAIESASRQGSAVTLPNITNMPKNTNRSPISLKFKNWNSNRIHNNGPSSKPVNQTLRGYL